MMANELETLNTIANRTKSYGDRDVEIRFAEIEEDARLAEVTAGGELLWPMIRSSLYFHMSDRYTGRAKDAIVPSTTFSAVLKRQWASVQRMVTRRHQLAKAVRSARRESQSSGLPACLALGFSNERSNTSDGRYRHPVWDSLFAAPNRNFRGMVLETEHDLLPPAERKIVVPGDHLLVAVPSVAIRSLLYARPVVRQLYDVLQPHFAEDGQEEFWSEYCLRGRAMRQIIRFISQKHRVLALLRDIGAKCIVLRHSLAWGGFISAANQLGIPVIEFQHGFTDRYYPSFHWPSWSWRAPNRIPAPGHVVTFGSFWSEEIRKGGVWPGGELHSFGSVPLDDYRQAKHRTTAEGDSRTLTLLYTTGIPFAWEHDFWRDVITSLESQDFAWKLMIKCHPKASDISIEPYLNLAKQFHHRVEVCKHGEIPVLDLIKNSIIHCSIGSTCHYESIALGTPTLILKFLGSELFDDLLKRGAARSCNSAETLVSWVVRAARKDSVWETWRKDTLAHSQQFFATGALANSVKLINQVVASSNES